MVFANPTEVPSVSFARSSVYVAALRRCYRAGAERKRFLPLVFFAVLDLLSFCQGNETVAVAVMLVWILFLAQMLDPRFTQGKGLMLLEETRGHTLAYPLENVATTPVENHVLDILELEEPPPLVSLLKRNDKVTDFMAQLYRDLEINSESCPRFYPNKHLLRDVCDFKHYYWQLISQSAGVNVLPNREDWTTADRIISLSPTESKLSDGLIESEFNRETLPSTTSHLVAAQLRIFLPEHSTFVKVSIYRNNSGLLELVDSTIATSREKTTSLNVTRVVSNWIRDGVEPKIYVKVDGGIESLSAIGAELETFIIAFFVDENSTLPPSRTRSKRAVEPSEEGSVLKRAIEGRISGGEPEGCHVQSLYLNFADIGWREWVIAPEGYSANYCIGACSSDSPMHNKMNATNHAIVQTLVHLVDPKRTDEAKCAPVQLSPAKILFIDNHGNVVMRRYQDMTVQECGCL